VLLHSGGIVRLYSLQHIITQVRALRFIVYFRHLSNLRIYLKIMFLSSFICLLASFFVQIINELFFFCEIFKDNKQ